MSKEDLQKIRESIDGIIRDKKIKKEILAKISTIEEKIKNLKQDEYENIKKVIEDFKIELKTDREKLSTEYAKQIIFSTKLVEGVNSLSEKVDNLIIESSKVKKVTVENLNKPEKFPTEIRVKNQPKFEVGLIVTAIKNLGAKIKSSVTSFISNKEPKDAIPVRLVDKTGRKFYDALFNVISGGGSIVDTTKIESGINDQLKDYFLADKDDDASPNYFGFVSKNGAWYIIKETISAGADTYRYVKGTTDYTTNWTGRAGLSYDYFYNVF